MKIAIVYNKKKIDDQDVINVFGATTLEHYSHRTVELVATALERGGHSVKIIEGGMSFIEEMKEFMPRVVSGSRPGMVFNMAYGIQGRNRYTHVPAMLEMLGIPYVGSGPEAHAVVQDKGMTKIVLQRNGIPTPGFWMFGSPDDVFDDLVFPVIVKPNMESTSMGMDVVDDWDSLRRSVRTQMEKYSQEILVEQFIPGREFAVGLLGNGASVEVLPIVEMDLGGDPNRIQTITDKKETPVEKICPAALDEEQCALMRRICLTAFGKLGLNDFTRVDLRMAEDGKIYVLELNSMASLGKTGSYYTAAKAAGYSYDSLINKILDVAAIRYFGESSLQGRYSYHHHQHDDDGGGGAAITGMAADAARAASGGARQRVQARSKPAPSPHSAPPLRSILRSYLRSHHTTSEKLLRHLVMTNSSVYNVEEVNEIGSIMTKRLEHLGFVPLVYKEFDVGDMIYYTNYTGDSAGIDVQAAVAAAAAASPPSAAGGSGGAGRTARKNDILMLSHLDTWYSNRDFAAFHKAGSKMYGSGIAESKGGLVTMLSALQALRFARRLKKARCGILLVTDDSIGGRFSKKLIRDIAAGYDYIVDLKWGMPNGGIATSCSGITKYHIDMMHIRQRDDTIKDVIPDMCKKVVDWKRMSDSHNRARVVISDISARTSFGNSPDYGSLTLTTRYVTRRQGDEFDSELHKIAKKRTKSKLDTHIVQQARRNPVEKTAKTQGFFDMVSRLADESDVGVLEDHRYASSSLGDIADADKFVLGSMGPVGVDYRTPNEHIISDSMIERALLLALVIDKLASERNEGGGKKGGTAAAKEGARRRAVHRMPAADNAAAGGGRPQ